MRKSQIRKKKVHSISFIFPFQFHNLAQPQRLTISIPLHFILYKYHRSNSRCKLDPSDVKLAGPLHQPGPFTSVAELRTFCWWTPEHLLQIKRLMLRQFAVSWTTGRLFVSAAAWLMRRMREVSMWGEFFNILWACRELKVCSLAICSHLVHIFNSTCSKILCILLLFFNKCLLV